MIAKCQSKNKTPDTLHLQIMIMKISENSEAVSIGICSCIFVS